MNLKKKYYRAVFIVAITTVITLVILEIVIRIILPGSDAFSPGLIPKKSVPPMYQLSNNMYLYKLNPNHPEISSQGLRDKEYTIPKPKNTLRILVLGDSVIYGHMLPRDTLFPERLESKLNQQYGPIDVINTGAQGYSTFNELHYYLIEGVKFQPDIVILSFCYNDIANPRLHWNFTAEAITNIPDAAIPNPRYDRKFILPAIEARKNPSILMKSALYKFFYFRMRMQRFYEKMFSYEKGKSYPTYITGEDTKSIKVLLNYKSPEWQWLRSMFNQLNSAVKKHSANLILVVVPLAYQLNENYPFLPQHQIKRYCQNNSILYLDLLPLFRKHKEKKMFIGRISELPGYIDIWHLTPFGHQLVAQELETFLKDTGLLTFK